MDATSLELRRPRLGDMTEVVDLGAGTDLEHLVHEDRALQIAGLQLLAGRTPGHGATDPVAAAGAVLQSFVPPVAVELRTSFEVETIEVAGPGVPAVGPTIVEVDDLRPSSTRRADHEEGALEPEEPGHVVDRFASSDVHVVVLRLPDDVEGLVEVEAPRHGSIMADRSTPCAAPLLVARPGPAPRG